MTLEHSLCSFQLRQFRVVFFAMLLAASVFSDPASAARRLAIVAGVNVYDNLPSFKQLDNAVNDARSIKNALARVGFDVTLIENPSRLEFLSIWSTLMDSLSPEDVVLFFFSGHGVQIDGTNYLLPRDLPANPTREIARRFSINFSDLEAEAREKKVRFMISILDACRDDPLPRRGTKSVTNDSGLAIVSPPKGSFVLFSADAGQAALDRINEDDRNSVYTEELVKLIPTEGLSLRQLAVQVRRRVNARTSEAGHSQFPAYYDATDEDFYFVQPRTPSLDQGKNLEVGIAQPPKASSEDWLLSIYDGVDFYGGDLEPEGLSAVNEAQCQIFCERDSRCRLYTFNEKADLCFLKERLVFPLQTDGARSGFYFRNDDRTVLSSEPGYVVEIKWEMHPNKEFRGFFFGGSLPVENIAECLQACEKDRCPGVSIYRSEKGLTCSMRALLGSFGGLLKKAGVLSAIPTQITQKAEQTISVQKLPAFLEQE